MPAPPVHDAPPPAAETPNAESTTDREVGEPPAPPAPTGFLADLRRSFQLHHHLREAAVQGQIARLRRQGEYLKATHAAMLKYLPSVCAQVRARQMPGELCLLPIVESGLDPYAFSSQGAGGLWQFVPATARRYGLKVDWWADERRDPFLATDAALDYLAELYGRFDDWPLALAAYNWGEGRVERAVRHVARATSGAEVSFFDIRMPRETARHVALLLAYAAAFAAPDHLDIALPFDEEYAPDAGFAVVETGGQIDLALAANAMGKHVDYLYDRNPALKRWATHPRGPHRLIVDADDRQAATTAINAIPVDKRLAWQRLRIKPNETLGHLALRFGTDVATLRQINGLTSNAIRAGDDLLVPTGAGPRPSGDGTLARAGPRGAVARANVYIVKPGDSIWRIARRLGVTRRALMFANGIGPTDILRIGQRLAVE